MIIVAIIVFTVFVINNSIAYKDCEGVDNFPDYYWRDYNGVLPPDALVGGYDNKGKPTYIGQMFNRRTGLIPSVIYPDSKTILSFAEGHGSTFKEDAKILCTRSPKSFKWVPTNNSKIHLLTGYHFVIGGFEVGFYLHIGRKKVGNELRPGKVFAFHEDWAGLTAADGHGTSSYDLLVYDYNSC